jgi:phenylacetic acid degradation operon negative regulatory protein
LSSAEGRGAGLLASALEALRDERLRAWSLAVSFLGDCIVPRGGSVGMATITQVLGAYGIDNGVVRTAMSRLAGDGWVAREKVGRNAFYALTPEALASSQAASRRIYAAQDPAEPCDWRLYLTADCAPEDRKRLRVRLLRLGAGMLDQNSFLLPQGQTDVEAPPARRLTIAALPAAEARAMIETAFDLSRLERDYRHFLASFRPALDALEEKSRLAGLEALALRVLAIHCFRRIVLRDPGIPTLYLPDDWPGAAARRVATNLWRLLSPATEVWLDSHAAAATGPLPSR